MTNEMGLLDYLAAKYHIFISDMKVSFIRNVMFLELLRMREDKFSLEEWNRAISYIVGHPVSFQCIREAKQYIDDFWNQTHAFSHIRKVVNNDG